MNKYKEIILNNRIPDHTCLAQHMDWEDVADSLSDILTGILGREVAAAISFYNNGHWAANLSETPLSAEEADELLRAANALGADGQDQFICKDEPLEELHATFAQFLLAQALPFSGETVAVDDAGIWFLGSERANDYICLLVVYPEADLPTDVLMVPCGPSTDKEAIKRNFANAMECARERVDDPDSDRLSRLDAVLSAFEADTGIRPMVVSATLECQLW